MELQNSKKREKAGLFKARPVDIDWPTTNALGQARAAIHKLSCFTPPGKRRKLDSSHWLGITSFEARRERTLRWTEKLG